MTSCLVRARVQFARLFEPVLGSQVRCFRCRVIGAVRPVLPHDDPVE